MKLLELLQKFDNFVQTIMIIILLSKNVNTIDIMESYELLVNVTRPESGISLRGIGKCKDNFYMFFNKVYYYRGTNELLFDTNINNFRIVNLNPERVLTYRYQTAVLASVCRDSYCDTVRSDVYFVIHHQTDIDHCMMIVVQERKIDGSVRLFDLEDNYRLTVVRNINVGIPFSNSVFDNPGIRFLYYGNYRVTQFLCDELVYPSRKHPFMNYHMCLDSILPGEHYKMNEFLTLPTRNDTLPMYVIEKWKNNTDKTYEKLAGTMIFGAGIDMSYIIFVNKTHYYSSNKLEQNERTFLTYRYRRFENLQLYTIADLFHGIIQEPPNTKTSLEGRDLITKAIQSVVYWTDESGRIMSRIVAITYFVDAIDDESFYYRARHYIIASVIIFIFFIILCFVTNHYISVDNKYKRMDSSLENRLIMKRFANAKRSNCNPILVRNRNIARKMNNSFGRTATVPFGDTNSTSISATITPPAFNDTVVISNAYKLESARRALNSLKLIATNSLSTNISTSTLELDKNIAEAKAPPMPQQQQQAKRIITVNTIKGLTRQTPTNYITKTNTDPQKSFKKSLKFALESWNTPKNIVLLASQKTKTPKSPRKYIGNESLKKFKVIFYKSQKSGKDSKSKKTMPDVAVMFRTVDKLMSSKKNKEKLSKSRKILKIVKRGPKSKRKSHKREYGSSTREIIKTGKSVDVLSTSTVKENMKNLSNPN